MNEDNLVLWKQLTCTSCTTKETETAVGNTRKRCTNQRFSKICTRNNLKYKHQCLMLFS